MAFLRRSAPCGVTTLAAFFDQISVISRDTMGQDSMLRVHTVVEAILGLPQAKGASNPCLMAWTCMCHVIRLSRDPDKAARLPEFRRLPRLLASIP